MDSRSLLLDPLRSSLRDGAIPRERTSLAHSPGPPQSADLTLRRALRAAAANRQMTNDDIACLRQLADWHNRQARYLLLTVPAGQHDQGRFHSMAAARLSRFADEATMNRTKGGLLAEK